jgi:D-proline reductase (dithiol) PrdB
VEILEDRAAWQARFRATWLAHYQETGEIDWQLYPRPKNKTAPAGPGIDLGQSRLMLITSSGAYLRASQSPFDAENPLGDYSIRTLAVDTPTDELAYAHTHYDHAAVLEDPQVLLPRQHLAQMVDDGRIGELAPSVVSFMGYQPVITRLIDETIPAILAVAQREKTDAALLAPA